MSEYDSSYKQAAECLRLLAHPDRLRLVERIIDHSETVSEMAVQSGIRQSVASEHLRRMEMCGLLKRHRKGRKVYYEPAHECLEVIMDCIHKNFNQPHEE